MLAFLKPISRDHSINRAVASLFIPQAFLKPEDVFEKSKNIEGFKIYPKKSLTKSTTFNLNNSSFGISSDRINGFVFERYDDKGSIFNIFKIENKESRSIISFESRKYTNWRAFKEKLYSDLNAFSINTEFYIDAVSLNYRDEFLWTEPSKQISVKEIFNVESELLNKKFLTSRNGTLILLSQGKNESGLNVEEKTEISFNNDIKRIIVDHQYAIRFDEYQLYSTIKKTDKLNKLFDLSHKENKNILKDILTPDVQKLIKIN